MIQSLVLSKDHRLLNGEFTHADSLQGLVQDLQKMGIKTGSPIGNRPPRFAHLVEGALPGEQEGSADRNPHWKPLREILTQNESVFSAYVELILGGVAPPSRDFDVFYFGMGESMASRLAHLVLKGKKRGTAGWVRAHEATGIPLPAPGATSLVTDGFGIPLCFIQTMSVEKLKFKDVTSEMAKIEGEGDLTLEDWKRVHWEYWATLESPLIKIPFYEDELIYFETFKLAQILGNADP